MKDILPQKFALSSILLMIFLNLSLSTFGQVIQINSSFNSNSQIFPFGSSGTAFGLSLNGNVMLYSDTSLVRIIMIDSQYNEYLVYEVYKCISPSNISSITNACDETCYSSGFLQYSIEIQVYDATVNITSIVLRNDFEPDGSSLQQRAKIELELQKVSNINSYISANRMIWFADTNAISNLPYSQKMKLFGDAYNIMGLDYYRSGIYDPMPNSIKQITNSNLVPDWDWRNRHGAIDLEKSEFYFNSNGKGWMTSIKNQDNRQNCTGLCYIYAPLAAMEGLANLYFNEFVNFDLSEQQILECDGFDGYGNRTDCQGGPTNKVHDYMIDYGAVDEVCYPENVKESCTENPFPSNLPPQFRMKIAGVNLLDTHTTEAIKIRLIEKGPMIGTLDNFALVNINGQWEWQSHAMALIGYGTLSIGDTIYNYPNSSFFIINSSHIGLIGTNYWIYKNSWGSAWGSDGYVYYLDSPDNGHPEYATSYITPVDDILSQNDIVHYYDKDKDGYYYWGIGIRPDGCPETEEDSDDSESRLGPLDENYFSIPIAPVMVVKNGSSTIHQNGIYSIFDQNMTIGQMKLLTFNIVNAGTAQLNLIPNVNNATITLSNYNSSDFSLSTTNLLTGVPINGCGTSFYIEFTLHAPIDEPKMVTITIHLDEADMDDYVFTLVFTGCTYSILPENICTNTTWNTQDAILKFSDVHVKRDAVLTINNLVAFTESASLIVEQGGTLIIDGGHITSLCDNNWQGTDVWGGYQ